jgi:hypothetical protein
MSARSSKSFEPANLLWLAAIPLSIVLATGCQSFNSPPSNNLASVTITNHSMPQIASAIQTVFETHYFTGGQTGPNTFTYQRPGSRMNNLAYGSYFFDEKVTVRVVVNVQPVYGGRFLLSCNASLIEDEGDPVFQDTHHVRMLRKWPYEQLLNDIKAQLGS